MFHSYLAAAFRNLAHNKLYAAINIAGLAVGFAAAILIALYVRDEFSYDKWIPGYERTYLLTQTIQNPGHTPADYHTMWFVLADSLLSDFSSVESVAKLVDGDARHQDGEYSLRHNDVEANEKIYWADPNIFDVLPLPVFAKMALQRPDGIVLTRSIARKYFGRDNAVGETIEIDRHYPVRVMAVIEDLPSNTHLDTNVIASNLATFSLADRNGHAVYAYLRLKPGASAPELERAMPEFIHRHLNTVGFQENLWLTPISDIHWHPDNSSSAMKPVDNPATVYAVSAIGILIVLVSCINFVNLTTARATCRALEVGVRKATGARRRDLMIQFMGESLLYTALAVVLSIGLVEILLPPFNAFLDRVIGFNYWNDPGLITGLAAATIIVGLLAGFYPAFVLSAFRPSNAVKKDLRQSSDLVPLRMILVVVQFSVLIGLIVATVVIFRQTHFALNEGFRLDKDQVVLIPTDCKTAFPDRVRALPGVRAAACSNAGMTFLGAIAPFTAPGGASLWLATDDVDFGFFELYGLKPLAGRFYSRDHMGDVIPPHAPTNVTFNIPSAVINETAARQLGFASPQAAIERTLIFRQHPPITIIGIVPDFSWDSIHASVPPSFYYSDPNGFRYLSVKLTGRDLPETLQSIASLWKQTGEPKPMTLIFLDQEVQRLYLDITRQGQLFGAFAGIALFLACLGLVGLAGATAERRTKEIGIRKSMGAGTGDILRLLTWEFAKPVIWANLLAWPAAYFAMSHWLSGFAYHIDLDVWMFLAAGAVALVIALATVSVQSLITARAKPVTALRYE
jgi:putative ABC transport system permease protein